MDEKPNCPPDQNGKLQLDSASSLELQQKPMSQKKPEELPNLEVTSENKDGKLPGNCKPRGGMTNKPMANRWPISRSGFLCGPEEEQQYQKIMLNLFLSQDVNASMDTIINIEINTKQQLEGFTNQVFEKAIHEPSFSGECAEMCKRLSNFKVTSMKSGENILFKKLIVTKCQEEFEKGFDDLQKRDKRIKEIATSEPKEKRMELTMEYEAAEKQSKDRFLGTIGFIGELYKQSVLTANIMHECLQKLLSANSEDSLESLCRLFTIIGKDLEQPMTLSLRRNDKRMDEYFMIMKDVLVNKMDLSFRVRSILLDVIDLRLRNWIPRHVENNPQRIAPIHQEAERERSEKQDLLQPLLKIENYRDRKGSGGMEDFRSNLHYLNVNQNLFGQSNATSWGHRSSCNVQLPPKSQRSSASNKPPSRERKQTLASVKKVTGKKASTSINKSSGSSDSSATRESEGKEPAVSDSRPRPGPALDRDSIEKKTKSIIDEYLHINDFQDASLYVNDLGMADANALPIFVAAVFNQVLERSLVARQHTGQLFTGLVNQKVMTAEQFNLGLREMLECAEDMEIDVPMFWQYLAEILSPMFEALALPLSTLKLYTTALPNKSLHEKLLINVINVISKTMVKAKLRELWQASKLQIASFLPPDADVQAFMEAKQLTFLEGEPEAVGGACAAAEECLPMDNIQAGLKALLQTRQRSKKASTSINKSSGSSDSSATRESEGKEPCKPRYAEEFKRVSSESYEFALGCASSNVSSSVSESRSKAVPEEDWDLLKKASKPIVDEFLHISDMQDASLYVSDLGMAYANDWPMFVFAVFYQVLERPIVTRLHTGQLLIGLINRKVLSLEQFNLGVLEILERAEVMETNVPMFWQYLAEILSPMFEALVLPLSTLKLYTTALSNKSSHEKFLVNVINSIGMSRRKLKLRELWQSSKLQIASFLPPGADVQAFMEEKQLGFLEGEPEAVAGASVFDEEYLLIDNIKVGLMALLQTKQTKEQLFDWINANIPEFQRKQPAFIRALVSAVASIAIEAKDDGNVEFDQSSFETLCAVIKQYVSIRSQLSA